jgi:hypothetical protein
MLFLLFVVVGTSIAIHAEAAVAESEGYHNSSNGAPNNVVTVATTTDSPADEESTLQVASYGGDLLDSTNLAWADAHDCTGCRSIAVAVQAVFATGHPRVVSPQNLALATNENCTNCISFAFAYQYVVTTDGPVHLSPQGRRDIRELRHQFADLAESQLALPELDARLHELADQFKADIDGQLLHRGDDGRHPHGQVKQYESEAPVASP